MVDSYGKYGGKFQHEKWPVMFSFSHALELSFVDLDFNIYQTTKKKKPGNKTTKQWKNKLFN